MTVDHSNYPKEPTFKSTGLDQPINKFVSPLLSGRGEDWAVEGTCVMIAPGLAITANHVIIETMKKYEGVDIESLDDNNQNIKSKHESIVFQLLDGENGYGWSVTQYFLSPLTDVCYLRLKPMFTAKAVPVPHKVRISLHPPPIGERIAAYGFPKTSVSFNESGTSINVTPKITIGEVQLVHQQKRDTMLPFPVFQTNARFDPGMSGGPVFNNSGMLCGLICTNLPPDKSDLDHISFVALLWPSMGTKVSLNLKSHNFQDPFPVLFLAENEYIHAEGWERVKVLLDNRVALKMDG